MNRSLVVMAIISCLLAMVSSGCGGGSGGGVPVATLPPVPTVVSFTNWSSVSPPTTVNADGISQDANYTYTAQIDTITDQGADTAASSASIKYRDDGTIERINISTPTSTLVWDETAGDTIADGSLTIEAYDGANLSSSTDIAYLIDAQNGLADWEYQTFGVWESGRGSASGTIGAISIGAPTTGAAIPTLGSATFTGLTAGIYVDAAGVDYVTSSTLNVDVDFAARTLDLTTSNTLKTSLAGGGAVADNNLNLTSSGPQVGYDLLLNSFSVPVTAAGSTGNPGDLAGTSSGQFYGPNAEELGGVFSLSNPATDEYYSGAYGAKQ